MASGTNPGSTYTISTGDPGVYHEDRVVVTEVAPSTYVTQMFRAYGATLNATSDEWEFQSGVSTAYATVQNPGGSIHYFTYSGTNFWQTSDWKGSDNNTVYNAVDFGTTAGGSASSNTSALSSLFTAMATATAPALEGGSAWIPQYNFPVNASAAGLTVPDQAIIQGLGTGGFNAGTQGYHFSISDAGALVPGIFWSFIGPHSSGGTYLRNLAFQWVSPGFASDTCLIFKYWSNAAEGCNFTDCPVAINFEGLAGSAVRCTVNYGAVDSTLPSNVTAFWVQGQQNAILGPSELGGGSLEGTSACVGIGGGPATVEHNTIRGCHIYGWNYGIDFSDINLTGIGSGTSNDVFDGNKIDCIKSCVLMQTNNTTAQIFNQTLAFNELIKSEESTDGSPIVFIDTNGGALHNIDNISLIGNTIYSNVTSGEAQENQYGVQIGTCAAVSIIGGRISQCGTKTEAGSDGTANICISGSPSLVTVSAVDLNGVYPGANSGNDTGPTGSAASEYALLISGNPKVVNVADCYMSGTSGYSVSITGNPETVRLTNCTLSTSALSVTGTPTSLIVTNCTGYSVPQKHRREDRYELTRCA